MSNQGKVLMAAGIPPKNFSWDFYAKAGIIIYGALSFLRWPMLPQFIDIYYHLHTAWGFLQAGGYSGWDFWQYAPFGRVHIYPPLFHFVLAFLIKIGINKLFLAKAFEACAPGIFLTILWYFARRHFRARFAFFVVLAFGSSFSFFLSLINNLPATLAMCFGFLALDCFLRQRLARAIIFLALAYYTHIAVPWVFASTIILHGVFVKDKRSLSLKTVFYAIVLAAPVLLKLLFASPHIQLTDMPDKYFSEFKPLDYLLAFFGLRLAFRAKGGYWLLISLFLASFIFVLYPYRFFSAQGYLPIIFLSAATMDGLYQRYKARPLQAGLILALLGFFLLVVSPTVLTEKKKEIKRAKLYLFDSTFKDMLFPLENTRIASTSLWQPDEYLEAVRIIQAYSKPKDIVYANYHILSACLASLADRANASALFPEIDPVRKFSPFSVAKIVILTKDNDPRAISYVVNKYNLKKIGENKLFFIYANPSIRAEIDIRRRSIPFGIIFPIIFVMIFLFWRARDIDQILVRNEAALKK